MVRGTHITAQVGAECIQTLVLLSRPPPSAIFVLQPTIAISRATDLTRAVASRDSIGTGNRDATSLEIPTPSTVIAPSSLGDVDDVHLLRWS